MTEPEYMNGSDVFILQNLLQRAFQIEPPPLTWNYDAETAQSVAAFQQSIQVRAGLRWRWFIGSIVMV